MFPPLLATNVRLKSGTIKLEDLNLSQLTVELQSGECTDFPGNAESIRWHETDIAWELAGFRCIGTVVLTNFRVVLLPGPHVSGTTDLPLHLEMPCGVLETVKLMRGATSVRTEQHGSQACDVLELRCRDLRNVSLQAACLQTLQGKIEEMRIHAQHGTLSKEFVEKNGPTAGWSMLDWSEEFSRQCVPYMNWKHSDANKHYDLCSSYPNVWWVPVDVSEELVRQASKFRSKGRCALLTWHHPQTGSVLLRGAQPHQGNSKQEADAEYMEAVQRAVGTDAHLVFLDCRSSAAATANSLNSGGTEKREAYAWFKPDGVTVLPEMLQLELDNLHTMRDSWKALQDLLNRSVPESVWLACLHETKWLDHCRRVTEAAHTVARCLHCSPSKRLNNNSADKAVVVVHCSDGWDRTTQVCTLAQLLLDPYYRTPRGFCVLIEKDWERFGHKFHDRVTGKLSKERSPIFLQWLFCVAAIQIQFPEYFQFSSSDLALLVDLWLSGWTGSLQRNTEKENEEEKTRHVSIWAVWLQSLDADVKVYGRRRCASADDFSIRLLRPVTSLKRFELWPWVFRFDEMELEPLRREYMSTIRRGEAWPPQSVWWVPDDSVSECAFCSREFCFYRRRHHCRACGRIFCSASACLSLAEVESLYGDKRVYICHGCSEYSRMAQQSSFYAPNSEASFLRMPSPERLECRVPVDDPEQKS